MRVLRNSWKICLRVGEIPQFNRDVSVKPSRGRTIALDICENRSHLEQLTHSTTFATVNLHRPSLWCRCGGNSPQKQTGAARAAPESHAQKTRRGKPRLYSTFLRSSSPDTLPAPAPSGRS